MDQGNSNASSGNFDLRIQWRSKIQIVVEKIELYLSIFEMNETLFYSLKLELAYFMTQDFSFEAIQLQHMVIALEETLHAVSRINNLIQSLKHAHNFAEDRLESITSHISEHDGRTHVRETNDLIEMFERMVSLICEMTSHFENAVTGIAETAHALTLVYCGNNTVQ
ncbi:hypothetical protein TNCV_2240151 [Trichonephila clavipes]|nr:hypothetical protein TNCV_2240151 [Trichonephila clavipes]